MPVGDLRYDSNMRSSSPLDREAIIAALDSLDAALDTLAAAPAATITARESLAVFDRLEKADRRMPAIRHAWTAKLTTEAASAEWGGFTWAAVLADRLRISRGEACRRVAEAHELGPRTAITGEVLEPLLPATAAAQAAGTIGAEHVRIIRGFLAHLPTQIDVGTKMAAEAHLAQLATQFGPEHLRQLAARLDLAINPDGGFDDAERARRRGITIGRQGSDGMSSISGWLDPQARATMDAVFAELAAPGVGNPADEEPTLDATPTAETAEGDTRSTAQRQHDALTAMGRAMLASGQLGSHHGLPCTIIVSTTLKELESGCGQAITGGGTLLPMTDVIRMAGHAHHYLVIFKDHTQVPLYLGRTKRLATPGQRIVLHASDRGCTRPGCTVPADWCEVHHAENDWAKGGQTDVDDLTLACGPDNRLVTDGGYQTRKRKDGRTEWIPPPHLDTGQPRTNDYHHPERLLAESGNETTDPDP